ncbi:hypothetical protein [Bradyrhizobium genosp. P]|uniref:hypothetical protein n=1 Tax=Bradyrhizobium genosp. P TaxID=83641 RepID=UPI003CEEB4CE
MVLDFGSLSLSPEKDDQTAKEAAEQAAAQRRAQLGVRFSRRGKLSTYESERARAVSKRLTNLIRRATGLPDK